MITLNINAQLIRAAQANQAKKDIRYYLCGILLSTKGDVVGTNGHTLFHANHNWADCDTLPNDVIINIDGNIPASARSVRIELPEALDTSLTGTLTTDGGKMFKVELVDGKYPDFKRVIPERLSKENLYSNAIAVDASLLAKTEKTFGKNSRVIIYHRGVSDALRVECDTEIGVLVIMPLSSNRVIIDDHLPLEAKATSAAKAA